VIRFTREEKTIILFLVASFFIGTGVLYIKKTSQRFSDSDILISERRAAREAPVNINEATAGDLIRIKNIGPVLAGRIIIYRKKHGPFLRKEDIKNVRGIGDKTYEEIKGQIALE